MGARGWLSVHLDTTIYLADKHVRRQEPNRSRRQRIYRTRKDAVAEEQKTAHKPLNVQSGGIVPRRIHQNPESRRPSHEEGLPPPVVVLRAQLYIRGDDYRLGNRDREQCRNDAQKPKDIVVG